jgi:hypothetical protein
MIPLALLLLACGPADQGAVQQAMSPPPAGAEASEALAGCSGLDFEEMRVLCHIELAAQAGSSSEPALAEQACSRVPEGTWRYECHFRAGEELGRAGHTVQAVEHCARADRFTRFCITHVAWALPPSAELSATRPVEQLISAMDARLSAIEQAATALDDQVRPEAVDSFRMALWLGVYYGTGRADPATAQAASPDQQPQARSAWMNEAARLSWAPGEVPTYGAVQRLLAMWDQGTVLEGAPLEADQRHGRYAVPLPVPCERQLQPVPLYGGGRRILGSGGRDDLEIAALEALFFRQDTTVAHFLPWIDDPRERVRWTAARLLRLSEPGGVDMVAALTSLSDHDDACVAWHANDALAKRAWERQPGGPR